jgi:hypothetical protein
MTMAHYEPDGITVDVDVTAPDAAYRTGKLWIGFHEDHHLRRGYTEYFADLATALDRVARVYWRGGLGHITKPVAWHQFAGGGLWQLHDANGHTGIVVTMAELHSAAATQAPDAAAAELTRILDDWKAIGGTRIPIGEDHMYVDSLLQLLAERDAVPKTWPPAAVVDGECSWHTIRLYQGTDIFNGTPCVLVEPGHPEECDRLPKGAVCWYIYEPFRIWWPSELGTYRIRPVDHLVGRGRDGDDVDVEVSLDIQVLGEDGKTWTDWDGPVFYGHGPGGLTVITDWPGAGTADGAQADAPTPAAAAEGEPATNGQNQ